MTITHPSIDKNLDAACASVVNEIGRTDGKASLLLAFNGAVLAGLASVADKELPPVTKAFGLLAVLTLGAAAVLLLLVVRPRLHGRDRCILPVLGASRRGRDPSLPGRRHPSRSDPGPVHSGRGQVHPAAACGRPVAGRPGPDGAGRRQPRAVTVVMTRTRLDRVRATDVKRNQILRQTKRNRSADLAPDADADQG